MSETFTRKVGSYTVAIDDPASVHPDGRGPLVTIDKFPVFDPRGLAAALTEAADERDRLAGEVSA